MHDQDETRGSPLVTFTVVVICIGALAVFLALYIESKRRPSIVIDPEEHAEHMHLHKVMDLAMGVYFDFEDRAKKQRFPETLLGPVPTWWSPRLAAAAEDEHWENEPPSAWIFIYEDRYRCGVSHFDDTDVLAQYDYRVPDGLIHTVFYDPTNGAKSPGVWPGGGRLVTDVHARE